MQSMMGQGRSFSGRERNCVFLNTGKPSGDSPRFADISASSGVDWPDDGRGVAIVDWDADGDLDMWISNRNAPRVRLMRNDTPSDHHYVALRLVGNGTDTNRDAIGARVEVYLNKDQKVPLLRTLRAGEGFIAQSTKWLHFGLGKADQIERVVVQWPSADGLAGNKEEFTGVTIDGRFRLVQGHSKAEPIEKRTDTIALKPGVSKPLDPSKVIRSPSVTLFRLPTVRFRQTHTGKRMSTGDGQSVLFTLWSSRCAPCRKELLEFTERADELRKAGIEVVALTVDSLNKKKGDLPGARAYIYDLKFPFTAQSATEAQVRSFEKYDWKLTTLNRPLKVPTSFLIGPRGHVSVVYKGRVNVDQLIQDVGHSLKPLKERCLAAAQLEGSTIDHPLIEETARTREATFMYRHATELDRDGHPSESIYHLERAKNYRSNTNEINSFLGSLHARYAIGYFNHGEVAKAQKSLDSAIASNPSSSLSHFLQAMINLRLYQLSEAVVSLRESIRLDSSQAFINGDLSSEKSTEVLNYQLMNSSEQLQQLHQQIAWLMATSLDEKLRNGTEAIRWAERLVVATSRRQAKPLWTLAAAYAEAGRFEDAVSHLKEAMTIVENSGSKSKDNTSQLKNLRIQLESYQQSRPFRDAS